MSTGQLYRIKTTKSIKTLFFSIQNFIDEEYVNVFTDQKTTINISYNLKYKICDAITKYIIDNNKIFKMAASQIQLNVERVVNSKTQNPILKKFIIKPNSADWKEYEIKLIKKNESDDEIFEIKNNFFKLFIY